MHFFLSSLVALQVKDPVVSLLWHRFDSLARELLYAASAAKKYTYFFNLGNFIKTHGFSCLACSYLWPKCLLRTLDPQMSLLFNIVCQYFKKLFKLNMPIPLNGGAMHSAAQQELLFNLLCQWPPTQSITKPS